MKRTFIRNPYLIFSLFGILFNGFLPFAEKSTAGTFVVANGQSIQEKLASLSPGDTLLVRAGTYSESLSLPHSGTADKPIVLMAYPGEKPVIQSSNRLISVNKRYWVIDGFILEHNNAANDAIRVTSSASNVVIRNSEIRNGQRDAFDISGSAKDIVIENNVIHDFVWAPGKDAHGIVTNPGATRIQILNNIIYNCGGDGIQLYASDSDPISSYSKDILIRDNQIYTTLGSNSENALDFKGVDGAIVDNNEMYGFENKAVVVQKGCRNLTFSRNIIHDSQRGMEFRGEGGKTQLNHVIRQNVIYNIRQYYAVKFDGVENVTFLNNTIASVSAPAIRVEGGGVTQGKFKNNLFYQTGKPSIKSTFQVELGNNGWFGVSAGTMSGPRDISGSDPEFMNAAQFDFQLKKSSPCVDAGEDVGLPYRGNAPDLGAYEYGESTTPVKLISFSASANGHDVKLRWRVASESNNLGYLVERSRNGKDFQSIGFVRSRGNFSTPNVYDFTDQDLDAGRYFYRLRQLELNGNTQVSEAVEVLLAFPDEFLLEQNNPNPFSLSRFPNTRISFFLPRQAEVQIRVYNILGQQLKHIDLGRMNAGRHSIFWNGRDSRGKRISPGLYFYELRAGEFQLVRRLAAVQ